MRSRLRVGLVVTGGVDRSGRDRVIPALLWLIERLATCHDVHVFALHYERTPCSYALLGATVHDLGTADVPGGLRRLVQRRRLIDTLRAMAPFDLFHAYWGIPGGWVATEAGRRFGVPTIVTADSGEFVADPAIRYGWQRRWLDRRLIRTTMTRAKKVTVCTRHMAALAAGCGVTATVIPLGVPAEHIQTPNAVSGPPWRLVHCGHLNRVKDQAVLLHALQRLRTTHPDVHLDMVGGDTLGGALSRLVTSLGLDAHVTFHGAVPHETVRTLLARAHLHVMSSRHEAAGVAILDAAALGVPTVGTRVGYVADWAPEAASAVAVGDVEALAARLAEWLSAPVERLALGRRAQQRTAAWSADHAAAAFDALYTQVCADGWKPSHTDTPGSGRPHRTSARMRRSAARRTTPSSRTDDVV